MKLTCPNCNQPLNLDTLTEDASARQLLALLPEFGPASGLVVAYLSFFRPRVQALRWCRALALATALQQLRDDGGYSDRQLWWALDRAIAALAEKRHAEGQQWQPMRSHRYLEKILASAPADSGQVLRTASGQQQQPSWQQQGAANLDQLRRLE